MNESLNWVVFIYYFLFIVLCLVVGVGLIRDLNNEVAYSTYTGEG